MRKVFLEVKVKLVIDVDEDIMLDTVMDEMDYNFTDTTTKADIVDTEILDYEVTDSK